MCKSAKLNSYLILETFQLFNFKRSQVIRYFNDLNDAFIKRGYETELLEFYFEKAMRVDRKTLLRGKEKTATQKKLPLVVTFKKIV